MSESEERLKRIEILLETCAKVTVNNQAEIKELRERSSAELKKLTEQMEQLAARVDTTSEQLASLSAMFTESVRVMRTMQEDIKAMQSEIKGLQTENKRILDHLFGESQN